jgi:type IV pilus assembly protein PilA
MKKMDNKGFSLVELIIVIAIMAILVGILAPQFIKYVEQSRQSGDLQGVDEVKTAVETIVADYGLNGQTITVTAQGKDGGGISVAGITNIGTSLEPYGVSATAPQKSNITVTWTYTSYSWSHNSTGMYNNQGTKYYEADGSKTTGT